MTYPSEVIGPTCGAVAPDVDAAFLRALVDLCPDGMAMLEGSSPLEATIAWANPALDRLLSPQGGSAAGRSVLELLPIGAPSDHAGAVAATAIAEAARWGDALVRVRDNAIVARVRPAPHPTGRGSARGPDRWALVVSSTSATGLGDEAMRASEERFRALAANAPMGVFFSEVGLRLGYVNDRFADLWGQPAAAALGMGWLDNVDGSDREILVDALTSVLAGEPFDVVVRVPRGDERALRWIRTRAVPVRLPGHGAGFVGSLEDVTDYRRNEEQLAHQATHDPLTGLPNRALLSRRLSESLVAAGPAAGDARSVALLFFDLDDFKVVNDTLGHAAGDRLLVIIAGRLTDGVRPDDLVVRFGGDEFVVLCQVGGHAEATRMAERLQVSLNSTVELDGTDVTISASVGVVVADGDHDADGLLRDADVAMYQAKHAGKARFALFDKRVRARLQERVILSTDFRRAMVSGEVSVVYQPIWDITGPEPTPVSVEALVRWEHPARGAVPPDQIIALAEDTGLIDDLGELVLHRACADLARWHRDIPAVAGMGVSVNLCTAQLRNGRLLDQIVDVLAAVGLDGSSLWLELVETVVIDDLETTLAVLEQVRAIGVRLAVDDFGTGYSSLAYLQRLPVQAVKIDRTFVGRLETSAGDAAIVSAIIAMANALGLTPIAEGVERTEQLAELRRLGCVQAQGYLLSRPVPAADIPRALVSPLPARPSLIRRPARIA